MENNIKQLRTQKNLTQVELANILNVSRYTIIRIEGGGDTTDQMVMRISRYFDKDPRDIFFNQNGHEMRSKKQPTA